MSMHGLNNLINNNVQLQRLDDISNIDNINNNVRHQRQRQQQQQQHQHYNLISIHHIIATSYNHYVKFNISMHIIIHQHIYIPSCNISSTSYSYNNHQHIYIYQFINHVILDKIYVFVAALFHLYLTPSTYFSTKYTYFLTISNQPFIYIYSKYPTYSTKKNKIKPLKKILKHHNMS